MPDYRENEEFIEMDFEKKMKWFKEEFKLNFGEPDRETVYGIEDREKYNRLLNKMGDTINRYIHEPLLYKLVETLNEITMKYDKHMGV